VTAASGGKWYFTGILMIRSFKHRGLKRLHEGGDQSGIRADLADTVQEILTVLDAAKSPYACPSGVPPPPAQGRLEGSLVRDGAANWRIVFRFEEMDAFEVELVDHH
jgi:proteic killer suppression protein